MIVRIVKLTIQNDCIAIFKEKYAVAQQQIKQFEGCKELSLLADANNHNIFFTYSKWDSEQHLNNYRNSSFFVSLWSTVKPMFAAKAEAWSLLDME